MSTSRLSKPISALLSAILLSVPFAATAQDSGLLNDGVYHDQISLKQDAGFRTDVETISSPFILSPETQKIFAANASLRAHLPDQFPESFKPLIKEIAEYIERMAKVRGESAATSNGITSWELAVKITRLSFCFATEPKGFAALIKVESSFDRKQVSNTGAVGFTQLTGVAIDEVNDQLGNRGDAGTRPETIPYLVSSIHCYMGSKPFSPMFSSGIIPGGSLVDNKPILRNRAKRWVTSDIDNDLIYGQISLKVLLANARSNHVVGEAAYRHAFKAYNGEPRGRDRIYARKVVNTMNSI